MKILYKTLLLLVFVTATSVVFAQDTAAVNSLIRQGNALHDKEQYQQAIDKYDAALKLDPKSYSALYEKAYSLYSFGKGTAAIPSLEAALKINATTGEVYNLLGNVYDDDKQPDKALGYCRKGIQVEPDYQRLYFNIAVTYYGLNLYTDAENYIITAINKEPAHASSHRMFAMIEDKLGNPGVAIMAWCNFLMKEPQTARAVKGLANLKEIINRGISKPGANKVNITVNPNDVASMMIPMAVTSATADKKGLSSVDSLTLQLTSLFKVAPAITAGKNQTLVAKLYTNFFQKLGNSESMPAFAHFITLATYRDEDLAWFKVHDKAIGELDAWVSKSASE